MAKLFFWELLAKQFSLLSKLVSNLPLCSSVFEINKKPLCCPCSFLKVTL